MSTPQKIGKYEVSETLGRGGMGVVLKATDPALGRVVAIKMLTAGFSADPDFLKRFYSEARSTARLHHPNIITVYDLGDQDGVPYLVMEFLEGEALDSIIAAQRILTLHDKLNIIVQVCAGLQYAHDRQIIHRDVKPANIMVLKDGNVKLVDFGIARMGNDNITRPGQVIGSINYMAPEQISERTVDARCDIFSTGVALYQLLTYQLPFQGRDTASTLLKIVGEPPPPLSNFLKSYPRRLDKIINRALAKDPNERYGSADEFGADLMEVGAELKRRSRPQIDEAEGLIHQARKQMSLRNFTGALESLEQAYHLWPASHIWELIELAFAGRDEQERREHPELAARGRPESHLQEFMELLVRGEEKRGKYGEVPRISEPLTVASTVSCPNPSDAGLTNTASDTGSESNTVKAGAVMSSRIHKQIQRLFANRISLATLLIALVIAAVLISVGSLHNPAWDVCLVILISLAIYIVVRTVVARFASKPEPLVISVPPAVHRTEAKQDPVPNVNATPTPAESYTVVQPALATAVLRSDAVAEPFIKVDAAAASSNSTQVLRRPTSASQDDQSLPNVRLTVNATEDVSLVGRSVSVTSVPFRIGRTGANMTIASDAGLSRLHSVIDWKNGAFTIEDLGSMNGTYLNGRRISPGQPETLPFGALIRLGRSTVLTFNSDDIAELPDLTGQTVDGRYCLTNLVRNGVTTALYEASDCRLPQRVSVKILSPTLARFPQYVEQFNREAQTAAQLRHPNICKILDFGQAPMQIMANERANVNYICMDLMEGGSLVDVSGGEPPPSLEQILGWLEVVTDALVYAHRQGVVHSGLKLSSIVFDKEGNAYVTDFGMAYRANDKNNALFLGSPDFLAPEQWDSGELTPLVDQYSLAVITYLLVTGSRAFEGQVDPNVRRRNFERGPVPAHEEAIRRGRPGLPRAVSEVLGRGMAVRAEDRYESVREFFLAFQHALNRPDRAVDKPQIFISYQRDPGSGWALLFQRELEQKHDIFAFVDTQRLDTAIRFPARLRNAIQDCDVFVCLLSATTLQSKWVQEEIRLAWEHGKPMIPVFQESYVQPEESQALAPHIETLISYDGVHLLDRRNVHVDHTIADVAKMVKETLRQQRGKRAS